MSSIKANICIIPARGGSKRIPRKNIKEFLGKPIIAYSINAALESGIFDEVMVSTDDQEIADFAEKEGAKLPFLRSASNSDDFSTTADVLVEVLKDYSDIGQQFSDACCIYPTAPFVTPDDLKRGKVLLDSPGVESVFPVVKFDYPVWRGLKMSSKGKIEMLWPQYLGSRSQDLEPTFHDCGQWYWFKVREFLETKNLFSAKSSGLELTNMEVQDIDTESDWRLAELKYEYLQSLK